jgi:hypothetical protein
MKFDGTILLTAEPKTTANKEVRISALAEPTNIASRDLLSAVKQKVAN